MSEKLKDGGPAFPTTIHGVTAFSGQPTIDTYEGMTLRDWFAGQAVPTCIHMAVNRDGSWDPVSVSVAAYDLADAMLSARQNKEGGE